MVILLKARNENREEGKKAWIMERYWVVISKSCSSCVKHCPLLVTVGPAAV